MERREYPKEDRRDKAGGEGRRGGRVIMAASTGCDNERADEGHRE